MVIGFSLAAPSAFPTGSNLTNVLSARRSLTAIVAGGLTLVLVVGEFDLSIGYQASLAGILSVGLMANQGFPAPAAVAVVLVVAVAIGIVNGLVITKLGVNSMIATLGTGTIVLGINFWYANGIPIALIGADAHFTNVALGHALLGIPNPIVFMIVILAALWVLLNQTSLGQHMQAVGGNREAATLSGIRSDRTIIAAFVVAAVFAAVAGVLLSSRIGSGQINAGDGYMLDAFAAVFLGRRPPRRPVPHHRDADRRAHGEHRVQRAGDPRRADVHPVPVQGHHADPGRCPQHGRPSLCAPLAARAGRHQEKPS